MAKKRLQKKKTLAAAKKQVTAPRMEPQKTAPVIETTPVPETVPVIETAPVTETIPVIEAVPAVTETNPVIEAVPAETKENAAESAAAPDWYKTGSLLGMMVYAPENIEGKLDYIRECNVNYLYLMTGCCREEELSHLADVCHGRGIRICTDLDTVSEERAIFLADQGADILRVNAAATEDEIKALRAALENKRPELLLMGNTTDCHILYREDSMAVLWHTVATKNVALLRKELDKTAELSKDCVFQNTLRSANPISWNLDFEALKDFAVEEEPHKEFLNQFLSGNYWDSFARGELYTEGETASLCGTTASLCGIERYGFEGNEEGVDRGIRYDITLHAFLLSQPGIPMIYSGDEIGQLNDYSYKENPAKASDSRWLHKGEFNSALAENRKFAHTVQGRLFPALDKLARIRAEHSVFAAGSTLHTIDTWDSTILSFVLENEEEKFIGIYNFGENENVAWINEDDGKYTDLLTGCERDAKGIMVPAFGFFWLCKKK